MAGYLSRSCDHSGESKEEEEGLQVWRSGGGPNSGSQLRKMPYDRAANLTFVCPEPTLPHARHRAEENAKGKFCLPGSRLSYPGKIRGKGVD